MSFYHGYLSNYPILILKNLLFSVVCTLIVSFCVRDSKGGEERAGAEYYEAPKRSEALHSPTVCLGKSQGNRARPT